MPPRLMVRPLLPFIAVLLAALAGCAAVQDSPAAPPAGPPAAPPSAPEATAAAVACPNSCSNFACFRERYGCMVANQSIEDAVADLKRQYDTNPIAKSQCHQLIHIIGRAAADKYGSVGEAYRHGDHFCWSGYHHGVMERLLANAHAEGKSMNVTLNTICQGIPGKERYSFDYYNCVHGLGHGVMFFSNYELFDSLKECNWLRGGWEQASCWSGVFMENVIADGFEHTTNYLKPDDPLYPCNAVEDYYKNTCYLMQTSYMLKVTGRDFKKVFALCTQAEGRYTDTCYQSLGRDASGSTISNVERTRGLCMLGEDFRQQSNCIIGAVKDFISYHHGTTQARALCETFDGPLREVCDDTLNAYGATL